MTTSRRLNLNGTPQRADAPSTTAAAKRKRAPSASSGGQSVTATFATENADAHSRQNVAISTGRGNRSHCRTAGGDRAVVMARMGSRSLCDPDIELQLAIWKLDDQIHI